MAFRSRPATGASGWGSLKKKGLEVRLTLPEYCSLVAGARCVYCGGPPPESGHGLDRIDSRRGYTVDNLVVACDACNRIKADLFTFDQTGEDGKGRVQGAFRETGVAPAFTERDGSHGIGAPLDSTF